MLAGSSDCSGSCDLSCGLGDAAEICTKRVRKQKTDRQDAELMLRLLLEDRFPKVWVPNWEESGPAANCCGTGTGSCRCARLTSWDLNRRIGVLYEWSVSWGSRKSHNPARRKKVQIGFCSDFVTGRFAAHQPAEQENRMHIPSPF
jgi:hypothetical protein